MVLCFAGFERCAQTQVVYPVVSPNAVLVIDECLRVLAVMERPRQPMSQARETIYADLQVAVWIDESSCITKKYSVPADQPSQCARFRCVMKHLPEAIN